MGERRGIVDGFGYSYVIVEDNGRFHVLRQTEFGSTSWDIGEWDNEDSAIIVKAVLTALKEHQL